ncbi:MAG: penicillin-binding protein 1C [Hyphomicrobiaceae bacterium]
MSDRDTAAAQRAPAVLIRSAQRMLRGRGAASPPAVTPPGAVASDRERSYWAALCRRGAYTVLLGSLFAVTSAGAFLGYALTLNPNLERGDALSVTVLDRNNRLLRAFTTPDGRWRLPITTEEIDGRYLDMLIGYEDRRFHSHHGVDPRAMIRATAQLVRNGRIISGGSTLTMQVARLLEGPGERSFGVKLRQMAVAIALERRLSKSQILDLYLKLAPFGGNVEGVRAASLTYFGKEPVRLSIAERALLVAIPQSPEARRPDRFPNAAHRARDRVLARAVEAGVITAREATEARRAPMPKLRHAFPRLAPHLAEAEVARGPRLAVHRLTLDRDRQQALERLAREHAARVGPRISAAVIAVEHATGEVVAEVGSAGYLDTDRQGAVDMTTAVRSPGSTLKPFIYGLAFERGIAHPETLIEDRPTRFGRYAPSNFDEDFHGTVSIREALALSLNIPAVRVLAEVGPKRLVGRMKLAGVTPQFPAGAEPSLPLALGGAGLTLRDLAQLYTALARGGEPVSLAHTMDEARLHKRRVGARRPLRRLLSPAAAWYVGDILKGAPPPVSARGARIAFKTGTSYGFRDAWAVGFDGHYTVAVWVGRPDGTSTPGMTGHGAAAPLLFDAFARLAERTAPLASAPRGVMRVRNSELPLTLRRFMEAGTSPSGAPAVAIAFPPDRAELEKPDPDTPEIVLKAEGGALPLTWVVDGLPLEATGSGRKAVWTPAGPGFARISVIDAEGRADRVTVRLR